MYIFSIYLCFHRAHGAAYVIKKARSQLSSEEGAPGSATSAATSGSGVSSESGSRGSSRGPFSHHRRRSRWEFHHIYLQIYAHAYARALSQLRPRLLQPEVVLLVRVVMWSSRGGLSYHHRRRSWWKEAYFWTHTHAHFALRPLLAAVVLVVGIIQVAY